MLSIVCENSKPSMFGAPAFFTSRPQPVAENYSGHVGSRFTRLNSSAIVMLIRGGILAGRFPITAGLFYFYPLRFLFAGYQFERRAAVRGCVG